MNIILKKPVTVAGNFNIGKGNDLGTTTLGGNKMEVSGLGFLAPSLSSEGDPLPGEGRPSLKEGPSGGERVSEGRSHQRSILPERESEEGLGEFPVLSSPKGDWRPLWLRRVAFGEGEELAAKLGARREGPGQENGPQAARLSLSWKGVLSTLQFPPRI